MPPSRPRALPTLCLAHAHPARPRIAFATRTRASASHPPAPASASARLRLRPPTALLHRIALAAPPGVRPFSDKQVFRTQWGTIKLDLTAKNTVGVAQSRGERPYQEDAFSVHSILVPITALKSNLFDVKNAAGWAPDMLEGYPGEDPAEPRKRQVAFFGVFDGHGGDQVAKYLRANLHALIEDSVEADVPKIIKEYRALGGYLRRYRGGPLSRFRDPPDAEFGRQGIGLDELAVLAFLKADIAVLADESIGKGGSVGTVALLHSLDMPHSLPHYGAGSLSLTIAHVGDTRAILASTSSGRAKALTENHHADSRVESERLRQSGTGIVTDSFGESRWGGILANTRGVGDREFKTLGVIGEPVVGTQVIKGEDWAFLVLVSDGITDSMSDQEIVDLCRGFSDPTRAAANVVKFAEDVGGEDNMTAVVVPLPGWSKMGGVDTSASRREYRLRQNSGSSGRQKRM